MTYRSGPWQAGVLSTQQHSLLQKAMTVSQEVCARVLTCIAASRGVRLPQGALLSLLETPLSDQERWSSSMLQAFRYSPAAAAVGAAAGQASRGAAAVDLPAGGPCAAHVDRSLLTLVYAPGQTGLQVRDVYGEWQEVGPLAEDQVLLIPGHTLEYALCGLLPAAQHRVVASKAGQPPRYSLTFKLLAAPAACIDFSEALDAAGHAVARRRYPPMSGADLMAQFSQTHDSVNASRGEPATAATTLVKGETSSGQPLLLGAAASARKAAAARAQQDAGTVALAARSGEVVTLVASGVLKVEEEQGAASATQAAPSDAQGNAAKRTAACRTEGRSGKARRTAVLQADASGAPSSAGVPSQQAGEGHTAPCDDHEGVAADDMIELTFLTVMPDVTDTLTVSRFATIASIVLAYHDETGIPPEQVRLIHAGRHLERDRTAADYGLESGDALHVVLRMSGD